MDATAVSLCMDNKLPIVVFNLNKPREYQKSGFRREDRDDRQLKKG